MAPDVTNAAAAAHASGNGGSPDSQLDVQVVKLLRKEVAQRRARVDELTAELDELKPSLRRYERVLAQLSDNPAEQERKPGPKRTGRKNSRGKGISDERLERIRQAVLRYARDHDEFRQVDIRAFVGENAASGILTLAFERLRQEGTVRFARQDGNNKWFRLTREAVRENAA